MALVNVTLDGLAVQVPEGTSVLEAARSVGIKIPALCYDPDLSLAGACRICVVEIDGMRNLPASCSTICSEGMVVRTNTPAVIEARRFILKLLISNHPLDCMTCEKSGNCLIQQYCYDYGVQSSPYEGEKNDYAIDDSNPFYIRDLNKCILCGRCVRACQEIVGHSVIATVNRGFQAKVMPFGDTIGQSDCVYCGSCIAVCPVGALVEKDMIGKGRKWEVSKVKTVCPYCGTGCTIDLNVKDGKVIGVTGNPEGDVNGRFLCVKGRFGYQFIHSEDRLKTPLVKENGEFREATWDEALRLVADKLGATKEKYGPDAIGVLSSARCTNEENYLLSKFTRAVVGTNNIDHCARL